MTLYKAEKIMKEKGGKTMQENRYDPKPSSGTIQEIRYFIKKRRRVPVNTAIIVLNIVIFLAVEATGISLDTEHMLQWGASYAPAVLQEQEYYRLLTSMFLHFGIQHLGNNMLVLLFIGDCLERNIGKLKYFLLYILGGLGANGLSLYIDTYTGRYYVSAGASGAVFAVIGGLFYVILINKGKIENFTARQLAVMAALSLYFGVTSTNVDNAAHFGGLFFGFLLGVLLYRKPRRILK